ncbi:MAG: hypothetical protein RLY14_1733, partial [Planctomycetota bacterium]
MPAEDLIGKKLVFVLAQKPRELDGQQTKIATLWPVMNFEDGSSIDCTPANFPSGGYVRWFRVPVGSWLVGDLVVGVLERNDGGYGLANREWYQVYGDNGEKANGTVCELIPLQIKSTDLYSLPFGNIHTFPGMQQLSKRSPNCPIYLGLEDSIAGPFSVIQSSSSNALPKYELRPTNPTGELYFYDRKDFEESGIRIIRHELRLSYSDSPPRGFVITYSSTFNIFKQQDLNNSNLSKRLTYLLPDDLLISKACNEIRVGESWKVLRDKLKLLVREMRSQSLAVSESIAEGLPRLLADAESRAAISERVVQQLLDDEAIKQEMQAEQERRFEEHIKKNAAEITNRTKQLVSIELNKLEEVDKQLKDLQKQVEDAKEEMNRIEERNLEKQMKSEEILDSIQHRINNKRSELLADLALLGPRFLMETSIAKSVLKHSHPETSTSDGMRFKGMQRTTSVINSPKIQEDRVFVSNRLHPQLYSHGICLAVREAEFFHACMLSSKIVGIPHPGWAVAYASAIGEPSSIETFSASPEWLSFEKVFTTSFATSWRSAVEDLSRLHVFVLEGIDRCPSHAWLMPFLNITAGWSNCLPDSESTPWPENIRLCVTRENSISCFKVPTEIQERILEFDTVESEVTSSELVPGHFPIDTWHLRSESNLDQEFQSFS